MDNRLSYKCRFYFKRKHLTVMDTDDLAYRQSRDVQTLSHAEASRF